MDALSAVLINLGFGGAMVATQIWFLRYLLTVTLPGQTLAFRAELALQREQRREDSALLVAELVTQREQRKADNGALAVEMRHLAASLERNTAVTLDRVDFGFRELLNELMERRGRGPYKAPPKNPPSEEGT